MQMFFCGTKTEAEKTKIAITHRLKERLKTEVSQEKTRVVNLKRRYSEFLGFKIKVYSKGRKQVVKLHISDKQFKNKKKALVEQVKRIIRPRPNKSKAEEIRHYKNGHGNAKLLPNPNQQNPDASKLNRAVPAVITNRFNGTGRKGCKLTPAEHKTGVRLVVEIKITVRRLCKKSELAGDETFGRKILWSMGSSSRRVP